MSISWRNPFLWFALSGILIGIALSLTVLQIRWRAEFRHKSSSARIIFLFSAGIFLLLPPLFWGLGKELLDIRLLICFGIFTLLSCAAWTFKKSFGIPLVFILVVMSTLLLWELSFWRSFSPGDTILYAEFLSGGDDDLKIQYRFPRKGSEIAAESQSSLSFKLVLAETAEWYFFLPRQNYVRIQEDSSGSEISFFFNERVPGVSLSQWDPMELEVMPGLEYEIIGDKNNKIRIRPDSSGN